MRTARIAWRPGESDAKTSGMTELKELILQPKPRLTLAVAESFTCRKRPGADRRDFRRLGFFPRRNHRLFARPESPAARRRSRAAAKRVNSVSADVAEQMARGACRLFGSEWASRRRVMRNRRAQACRSRLPGGPRCTTCGAAKSGGAQWTRGVRESETAARRRQMVADAMFAELLAYLRSCGGRANLGRGLPP